VNWTGSTLPSLFGDDFGGSATNIICESCHRLAEGNIPSGDGNTNLMLEAVGSTVPGGDSQVAYDYAATPYLCGGCHLIPGGTHPLQDADDTAYAIGATGAGNSYLGVGLGMNCESCHSAHDAVTQSGSYILDGDATVGTGLGTGAGTDVEPTIDYTLFCAVCHGAFE
jgi:hypothetical protein